MHYLNLLQMCKRTYSVCDNIAGQDSVSVPLTLGSDLLTKVSLGLGVVEY